MKIVFGTVLAMAAIVGLASGPASADMTIMQKAKEVDVAWLKDYKVR